jgi:hypothetical protein
MTRGFVGPRRIRLLAAVAAGLTLLLLLLGGCTLLRRPADPLAAYRPALGSRFIADPAQLAAMPQYSITVQVNPASRNYTGTVEVSFPVTGSAPLKELYFRLYPNLPQFNGQVQVTSVTVNGASVNFSYAADGTAVRVVPPKPLAVGQPARVAMSYTGQPPEHKDDIYTLVGKSKGVFSLGTFYPIIPASRAGGPALEEADPQGDEGFQEAALYDVALTTPADQVVAATGTLVGEQQAANGWVTRHYVQGPAREFSLVMSPEFQVLEEDAYGTRVRSYFMPDDADGGKSALYDAVAALQIYSDEFGPYPYRDMAVVEAPLGSRGQEFPGMSLIGAQVYSKNQTSLEKLIVHEVAHQWWYNQVGSDQTMTPWLDEGLAEYSMYVYYTGRHGAPEADTLRLQRWDLPVASARRNGMDMPIGLPVTAYKSQNYEQMIYAKGALFFATLRDQLGPSMFRDALRNYLDTYRWRIAPPEGFRKVAEQASGKDMRALFKQWLQGNAN